MYTTSASAGVSNVMVDPFSRLGASGRQKGPRMAESVAEMPALAAVRCVMSSTSLVVVTVRIRNGGAPRQEKARHLRLQPDNVTEQDALVAALRAHLPSAVDHVDAREPLVHGQVNLSRKIMNVLDQRRHDSAQSRGGVGAHRLDDMVGEVLAERRAVLL